MGRIMKIFFTDATAALLEGLFCMGGVVSISHGAGVELKRSPRICRFFQRFGCLRASFPRCRSSRRRCAHNCGGTERVSMSLEK